MPLQPMMHPSMVECGSRSINVRSLNVSGLAFVRVDDEVVRFLGFGRPRHEAPLHPHGETRAAASANVRRFHLREQIVAVHLQCLLRHLITAVLLVGGDRVAIGLVVAFAEEFRLSQHRVAPYCRSPVEDAIHFDECQVLVVLAVDLHHRRGTARCEALRRGAG